MASGRLAPGWASTATPPTRCLSGLQPQKKEREPAPKKDGEKKMALAAKDAALAEKDAVIAE